MTQTPQTKLRFGAKCRLKSAASISQVFSPQDKVQFSFSTPYFRVLAIPSETSRLAVVMQKKNFKHAVTRNRLKRLVREYFRTHPEAVAGADIVILGKRALIPDSQKNKESKASPNKSKKSKGNRNKNNLKASAQAIAKADADADANTLSDSAVKLTKDEIAQATINSRRQEKALQEQKQAETFAAARQSLDFTFSKMHAFFARHKEN